MNIKEAKQEIKHTVQAYLRKDEEGRYQIPVVRQRPVLLMGPPGIGKTQIMEQIARECRIGLVAYTITHHTRQSAVGLPFIVEEEFGGKKVSVTEYTMSEIIASVYRTIKETGLSEGILFIDEINCVSETLAPTMLQFLQGKTFGNQAVPEGWIIVAAGNPPEYNKSVREFDMVTLDRVRRIDVEADVSIWKEYAREQGISPIILSYLELRPQNFYRVHTDVDGMQFVTARGWEDLSHLMNAYEELDIPVTEGVIREFLSHEDVAKDVSAYVDLYKKYEDSYGIPEILQGKVKTEIYERLFRASFDEKLSVVNLLLSGLQVEFQKVARGKALTDQWFVFLKQYRQRLLEQTAENGVENGISLYEEMLREWEAQEEKEKTSGFVTREQEKVMLTLGRHIRQGKPQLEKLLGETGEKVSMLLFDLAREPFSKVVEELERTEAATGLALEHAFDFMEHATLTGQEMVVFVTELAMGSASAMYLAEKPCERYHKYNQELLLGTKRAELMAELETGKIRAGEHIREL